MIKDKGFDGIAIKLGGDFAKIKIENDIILVGSAVLDNYFSNIAIKTLYKVTNFYLHFLEQLGEIFI